MSIIFLSDKVTVHNVHNTHYLITDLNDGAEYLTCTFDCVLALANCLNEGF